MKIVLTGGGTGGHFYPLIAVTEEIRSLIREKKLISAQIYYFADKKYNQELLEKNDIKFVKIPAGTVRKYFSLSNFSGPFLLIGGILKALWKLFWIYPDVVFSKGGYVSVPTLWAARILRIPVIIHESDSHPGKANLWSGKFAVKIALSYPEAVKYFPPTKTAVTGNPIRQEILHPVKEGAHAFLELDKNIPIILVLGGSSGSQNINEVILKSLPTLLDNYQIIHQTGEANFDEIKERSRIIVNDEEKLKRYKPFAYLDDLSLRMAAGATSLIISRAGSAIFEIAYWEVPSIIIPIPEDVSHDQRTNAFTYARSGSAVVIEENNLSPSILISEINRLFENKELIDTMRQATKTFAKPGAGRVIADEIVNLALSHEE